MREWDDQHLTGITTTVFNMKGGVGKTTLTVNLAACLAERHSKKVLVVDLDPQFNATQYMISEDQYKHHVELAEQGTKALVYDIFRKREDYPSTVLKSGSKAKTPSSKLANFIIEVPTLEGKLDLIPSHLELMDLPTARHATENRLKGFIDTEAKPVYDFIFIDCPPTMSIYTLSAYIASDAALIPVKPDYLSSLGIPLLIRAFREYKENTAHDLEQLGIVFTMVQPRYNVMKEGMRYVKELTKENDLYVFKNYMRSGTSIAEAVGTHTPVFKYARAWDYWEDIYAITDEFLERIDEKFGA